MLPWSPRSQICPCGGSTRGLGPLGSLHLVLSASCKAATPALVAGSQLAAGARRGAVGPHRVAGHCLVGSDLVLLPAPQHGRGLSAQPSLPHTRPPELRLLRCVSSGQPRMAAFWGWGDVLGRQSRGGEETGSSSRSQSCPELVCGRPPEPRLLWGGRLPARSRL